MKRPTTLLGAVLLNEGLMTSVTVERDVLEIERRFEHEGMSFLAITLPSLCDTLDRGLAEGRITPLMFHGFKPCKRGGRLPALLSGFFIRVFEMDGTLKDSPCMASIRAIRQITRLFKKVELLCSKTRIAAGYERYKSNDVEIPATLPHFPIVESVSGMLWSSLQTLAEERFYCSPGVFGTGATAERKALKERYTVTQWPTRSEISYPSAYHTSHREDDLESFDSLEFLAVEDEQPVRVVQVAKTLKSPRTISVEPSYMMLMQQSIAKVLMDYLESNQFKYKSIRFSDQSENKRLAQLGSVDGSLATIDLKDASDLVSNDLVKSIFKSAPTFLAFIQDCRSTTALLPGNDRVVLRKFASMGSALCFPIEAMVFFTLVMSALVEHSGKRPTTSLLQRLSATVAVYGDDIIVPAETVPYVRKYLTAFGLKVNEDKSFSTGFFRESCGGDYYKGHDITPSYCRSWDSTGLLKTSRVVTALVSLSNQFYTKGLWHASQLLRDALEARFGRISRTTASCGSLTFNSVFLNTGLRWEQQKCCYRAKGISLRHGKLRDPVLDTRAAMLLCFGPQELQEYRAESRCGSPRASAYQTLVCQRPIEDSSRKVLLQHDAGFSYPESYGEVPAGRFWRNLSEGLGTHHEIQGSSRERDGSPHSFEIPVDELPGFHGLDRYCVRTELERGRDILSHGNDWGSEYSIDSYSSNTKSKWTHINVVIPGWAEPLRAKS